MGIRGLLKPPSFYLCSEVVCAGPGGYSRCWQGLKGAVLLLHVPSGVSLPPAVTARLILQAVAPEPEYIRAKLLRHMVSLRLS